MDNVELVRFLADFKKEMTEEITDVVAARVSQATDAMHNSVASFLNSTVPRFHLWVIYPLLAVLYVAFTYMMTVDNRQDNVESGIETEIRHLIKELNKKGVYTNDDATRRMDALHEENNKKND